MITCSHNRNLKEEGCAAPGRGFDSQCAVKKSQPLPHSDEAEMALADRVRVEALSIILDDGSQDAISELQDDADARRRRMPCHVGKRLLDDAVSRGLDRGRQAADLAKALEIGPDTGQLAPIMQVGGESPLQSEVIDSRGAQVDRGAMNVAADLVRQPLKPVHLVPKRVGRRAGP